MKALEITIEFATSENATNTEFRTYKDTTVFYVVSKLRKEFPNVIIYDIKARY